MIPIAIVVLVATKKLMSVIQRNVLVVLQIIKEHLARTDKVKNPKILNRSDFNFRNNQFIQVFLDYDSVKYVDYRRILLN